MRRIIAGRQPVLEALKAGAQIEKVAFLAGVHGRVINDIRSLAKQNGVQALDVGRQEFRELASDATTQGVVALVVSRQSLISLEAILEIARQTAQKGFLLILDEIEDPHNLCALVRTAECAGVHGVILPKHRSAHLTETVSKTSAGAVEHMAIAEVTNIVNTIEELKTQGFWIVGLDAEGGKEYTAVDYSSPVAVIVGNEGKGIRRLVKDNCDFLVRIPLHGKVASLNASVAGALVMYEVARQRQS